MCCWFQEHVAVLLLFQKNQFSELLRNVVTITRMLENVRPIREAHKGPNANVPNGTSTDPK